MRITNIEQESRIFTLTFKPNFFERILGFKDKTKKYRLTDSDFLFGGGGVYVDEQGNKLSNGSYIGTEIDKFRRRF